MNSQTRFSVLLDTHARRCRAKRFPVSMAVCVALLGCGFAGGVAADYIVVPNGDFSAPSDAGSVGGGLLGSSGINVPIGAGPWKGTFHGVIALLAPPLLQVDSITRSATVSDVLGIQALSILNNGGYFSQTLAANYQPNTRYTLISDIRASIQVDLPILGAAGVGTALRQGTATLASSTTAAANMLRSDVLDATTRRIALTYDSGPGASGPIDIKLFDEPQGLLDGELEESAEFSDVRLARSTTPAANSTLTVSGGGSQAAAVGEVFPAPLVATVRDQNGNPQAGVLVTLSAPPPTLPSAVLQAGSEQGNVVTAFTDVNGQVILSATADPIAGCYSVTGSVPGIANVAVFHLHNFSTEAARAYRQAHPDAVTLLQDSVYCNGFE